MEARVHESQVLWRIKLFDGPKLEDPSGNEIQRFRSQRVGALLAYLALHLGQRCPREVLAEALWPEEDPLVSANRLRVALASLRRQLEPPGTPFGTVLDVSVPGQIRLRPEMVWCDVVAFERALKTGRREEAARLACGTLLPGYYEEWILTARDRFETLCENLEESGIPESVSPPQEPTSAACPPPRHRLPLYLTRFFGREQERQRLAELLESNRLVTVTGTGGIGKTRMVVEAARDMTCSCAFVPLADLASPERIPEAILQALLITSQTDTDPVEQLVALLRRRDAFLLILDNAEHLLAPLASLSLRLLEELPSLRILVTSRQPLEIAGEATFAILPLETPLHPSLPERLLEFPAVALFLDRARNVRADYTFTPRHADAIVEICRRVEGVPLALELAAARISSQTPRQIADMLATCLMELKARHRDLPPRHRSLRAAMQGSLDLLTAEQKACFAALSVFQGGWTVEAARAVTECEPADEVLDDLVTRSLVVAQEDEEKETIRYAFLEPLRQYAGEQLSSAERLSLSERHADYFLTLAAPAWEEDMRHQLPLDAELENLLVALEWGKQAPNATFWHGLVGVLSHAYVRGHHRLALPWVEYALSCVWSLPDSTLRSRIRSTSALLLTDLGHFKQARRVIGEIEAEANRTGDPAGQTLAWTFYGYLANDSGESAEAVRLQRQALQQARTLPDSRLLRRCLALTSRALYSYSGLLGWETEAGKMMLQESEALARELMALLAPFSYYIPYVSLLLALLLFAQHKTEEAYALLKDAQHTAMAHHTQALLMYCFYYESAVACEWGLHEYAALRLGASLELQERIGYHLASATERAQALQDRLENQLGKEHFHSLIRRGRHTPPAELAADRLPAAAFRTHVSSPSSP